MSKKIEKGRSNIQGELAKMEESREILEQEYRREISGLESELKRYQEIVVRLNDSQK